MYLLKLTYVICIYFCCLFSINDVGTLGRSLELWQHCAFYLKRAREICFPTWALLLILAGMCRTQTFTRTSRPVRSGPWRRGSARSPFTGSSCVHSSSTCWSAVSAMLKTSRSVSFRHPSPWFFSLLPFCLFSSCLITFSLAFISHLNFLYLTLIILWGGRIIPVVPLCLCLIINLKACMTLKMHLM